jgi:hypothetical protein
MPRDVHEREGHSKLPFLPFPSPKTSFVLVRNYGQHSVESSSYNARESSNIGYRDFIVDQLNPIAALSLI